MDRFKNSFFSQKLYVDAFVEVLNVITVLNVIKS